jgi:hypothetical protein
MNRSPKNIQTVFPAVVLFGLRRCLLAFIAIGLATSAFARDLKVPDATFDEAAARDFPQMIYDKIRAKIVSQTTFAQVGPEGLVRWSTRTLKLVDFVKAPSRTYPDTYLFAMRYLVSVMNDRDPLAIHGTSCQVVVVYKGGEWDEPTVVCEPVKLEKADGSS